MDKNLEKHEQEKKIEEIAEQDWPLLRELESTRFSLKNKKGQNRARQSIQTIKKVTEEEDQIISEQNLEDEKLVDEFLSVKPSNSVIVNTIINKTVEEESNNQEEKNKNNIEVTKDIVIKSENNSQDIIPHLPQTSNISNQIVEPAIQNPQITSQSIHNVVSPSKNEESIEKSEEISKLIARGMAKTYINKTDNILNPLRFIISNLREIGVALIQFIMPAIITWYLTTNVEMISKELSKEAIHIQVIYTLIFYFASLFLWISGQVLFSGLINILKQAMTNLAKVGKS